MPKKKVALFDFDGTIAHTVEEGVAVYNRLAARYNFQKITSENVAALREKNPREAMKVLRISVLKVPVVLGALRAGLKNKIAELTMPEGVRQALLELKKNGYTIGIITSNSKENVLHFLKSNKIEVFDFVQAGSGIFGKARSLAQAILKNRLNKLELVYIGDEIRDIEAARKNHIRSIGVTWGVNSRKGLERAHPNFVVESPKELIKILV